MRDRYNAGQFRKLPLISCSGFESFYEQLLTIARGYPAATSFQAFCTYISWQQATEEAIPHHFRTGTKLREQFLPIAVAQIRELFRSLKSGLGADEVNEYQEELDGDSFKGGD